MIELKIPSSKLKKKMYNLILDNQSRDIKLLLFKKGQSIPSFYDQLNPILKHNKIYVSKSTFKNMLMDSNTQRYDWEKRLKIINLIFEYLDPEKINAVYEGIKLINEKKIRSIMELLKSDCIDKNEYQPEEVIWYTFNDLPENMKTYLENYKDY